MWYGENRYLFEQFKDPKCLHLFGNYFSHLLSLSLSLFPSFLVVECPSLHDVYPSFILLSPNCVARCDMRDDLIFYVVSCIEEFPERLEARRYNEMGLSVYALIICDERHGRESDTAVCARKKRCWHRGSSRASELSCYSRNKDSLYVRCSVEVGYERRLSDIVIHIGNVQKANWYFVLDYVFAFTPSYDLD